MDWMALAELGVSFLTPLVWAFSLWLAVPSIIKLITVWRKISHDKKEKKELEDKGLKNEKE